MKKIFWLSALLMSFILTSCQKATFVNADKEGLIISRAGGSVTTTLHSDATNYSIEQTPEWLTAEMEDSVLVCEVEPNETGFERFDTIYIEVGGKTLKMPIRQADRATFLTADKETLTFGKDGGKQTVNINTDAPEVHIDAPAGISATISNGVLTVVAKKNTGNVIEGDIMLEAEGHRATLAVRVIGAHCTLCGNVGEIECPICKGTGIDVSVVEYQYDCHNCGGSGELISSLAKENRTATGRIPCPMCKGSL